jgi:signal recognition particle receptor subunit beta
MGAAFARDAPPVLQAIVSSLLRTRLELALAGLDGAGKTTLCSVLQTPDASYAPTIPPPTIGLVVQRLRYSGIALTLWDLGGHNRFRDDWTRHLRGCGALIFIVDVADDARMPEARQALHRLLDDPGLRDMPLLILANKTDLLPPHQRAQQELRGWPILVEGLSLGGATSDLGGWSVLGVSSTRRTNLSQVLRWLVLKAHGASGGAGDSDAAMGGCEGGYADALRAWWRGGRRSKRGSWSSGWGRFSLLPDASVSLLE